MNERTLLLGGRVALVTGANSGIGLVTARELARRGARVFVACRSLERAQAACEQIATTTGARIEPLELDLGDLASVQRCAERFLALDAPLHLLINNAGVGGQRGLTQSGFELAFGTNHVGHFQLTRLLLERLRRSAPARVVTVSSRAHARVSGIDWSVLQRPTRSLTGMREYGVSKLANVLFSAELARRLDGSGVSSYALHPGVIATEIWREIPKPLAWLVKLPMKDVEQGAATTLYCATAPEVASETGQYYSDARRSRASKVGRDPALASDLWRRSEGWTSS